MYTAITIILNSYEYNHENKIFDYINIYLIND